MGERASLWPRAPKKWFGRAAPTPSQEELEMRAEAFAAEGMMGKATAVFKGERPAPVDATTTADMKAKHPDARPSEAARCGGLRPVAAAAALAALPEEVIRGVKSFPEGSAGGMSGLKPQHLKDALVPGYADELARSLAEVVNLLASGRAHPSARQWVCCASLTALAKPDGGLRPIAIRGNA
jgi:hypothetical protein